MDHHWNPEAHHRTGIGELVYASKTYGGKLGNRSEAQRLGKLMARGAVVANNHGRFALSLVDIVLAVPAYPAKKPFNLPDILAQDVRSALGNRDSETRLTKIRQTPPAKTSSPEEVVAAYANALMLVGSVRNKVVLLVDDVVRSGTTLGILGSFLESRGAASVGAFVASKAESGMAP